MRTFLGSVCVLMLLHAPTVCQSLPRPASRASGWNVTRARMDCAACAASTATAVEATGAVAPTAPSAPAASGAHHPGLACRDGGMLFCVMAPGHGGPGLESATGQRVRARAYLWAWLRLCASASAGHVRACMHVCVRESWFRGPAPVCSSCSCARSRTRAAWRPSSIGGFPLQCARRPNRALRTTGCARRISARCLLYRRAPTAGGRNLAMPRDVRPFARWALHTARPQFSLRDGERKRRYGGRRAADAWPNTLAGERGEV